MTVIKKIALLGDPAVGKTSLVRRFVFDMFEDKYITTIGAKVVKKEMQVKDVDLKMMIWDLLGQDSFNILVNSTLKGVEGALIVFDLTRKNTLDRIDNLINVIKDNNPDAKIVFLGNKVDLEEEIEVDKDDIEQTLSKYEEEYYLTSAKTGENVEEAFKSLAEKMIS